ncbi:hypothetical protein EVG20_g2230 [Dentipellis fragilis]|uniref:Uncharacterized protein n=1 Tax=Dentipellis fragilis TaxID=205917 RepID=A0A4Y9ZAF9_9AGAM|nr:hypothetical protein EVG20_g2230 [Dentipellis fragilis]
MHKRPGGSRRLKSTHRHPPHSTRTPIMQRPAIEVFNTFVSLFMALSFVLATNMVLITASTGSEVFPFTHTLMTFAVLALVSDAIGLFATKLVIVPGEVLFIYAVLSAGLSTGWLAGIVKAVDQTHPFNLRANIYNSCEAQSIDLAFGWMCASFALHVVSMATCIWRAHHKEALRWRQAAGDTKR